MFVIGITGGIAAGKSTLTEYLKPAVAAIIDADEIGHDILKQGSSTYQEIVTRFGNEILNPDGSINRQRLGQMAFADPGAATDLNKLTHPGIIAAVDNKLAILERDLAAGDIVVLQAPLLIEAGLSDRADLVVVVEANREERVRRLVENRKMLPTDARARMEYQLSDEEKELSADIIAVNETEPEDMKKVAENIILLARGDGSIQ